MSDATGWSFAVAWMIAWWVLWRRTSRDTRRLDALSRMVAESATRQETVELDGRLPSTVMLSRWWPGEALSEGPAKGALENVSEADTLRAAIDAAMRQGGEQDE